MNRNPVAWLEGRDAVLPEDIRLIAPAVLRHRLMEATPIDHEMPRKREALIVALAANRMRKVPAPEGALPQGRFATLSQAAESFRRSREQTIAYIASCQDDLRRLTTDHPLIGAVSGQEIIILMIAHPSRHAAQVRELRQNTFAAPPNLP